MQERYDYFFDSMIESMGGNVPLYLYKIYTQKVCMNFGLPEKATEAVNKVLLSQRERLPNVTIRKAEDIRKKECVMEEKWYGFNCEKLVFEGHQAIIIRPREEEDICRLAVKTEYWSAFQEAAEIELVNRGFTLCYIKNDNRWGTNEDLDRKARFIRHIQNKYKLSDTCVPIGMSCGGLIAIKLAARYPELISCLYLDAPVVNYMSCPCGFGSGNPLSDNLDEILNALNLKSVSQLIAYRDMPLDHIPDLVAHKIPIVMVSGDSDEIVPYIENGIWVEQAYKKAGLPIEVYMKPGCGHHPHGLANNKPVIDFIMKYNK